MSSTRARVEHVAERARRRPTVRALIDTFEWEQRSGAGLLAGGLAYRFFVWLVPFGLVVAAVASFWVRESPASLRDAAKGFGLGGVAANSATSAVEDGARARWYLLAAGVLLAAWAGLAAVRALRVAAIIAWGLDPYRLRRPLRSSAAFAAVAVAALSVSVFASWARHNLGAFGLVVTLADAFMYAGVALYAFTHLPRPVHADWRVLLPGALFAGAGLTAVHLFLAYYLAARLEHTPSLYGTLGASTVVLLTLYLIARLLVSAMFLNATLDRRRSTRP
jgi:uncharacterized BrkB/YihY/UPF0761 family membrane protein